MALEAGGRGDKSGNQYENFFLGKQLFLLAEGKLKTVEVEPLGEEGKGIEFVCETNEGCRKYYQCKASNGTNYKWSIAALAGHNVFSNAKSHILRADGNEFHFISPLSYDGLNDLCERARKNHAARDFLLYQVSNDKLRQVFRECECQFGLSSKNEEELIQLVYILSMCYFDQVISTQESRQDIEERIAWFFTGSPETARLILENHVNDAGKYGVVLSTYDVMRIMAERGHYPRDYGRDETIVKRIQTLNEIHWGEYKAIDGKLFQREAAELTIKHLMEGRSVVLHGKAGVGKSGCVELVTKYLYDNQIPYLRIKLDKNIPHNSSIQYGADLGLPDSPVRCLQKVSGGKPCVLVLDQLDALRWTASHSPTAIDVCKELLAQIKTANAYFGARVAVLFVVRTFDFRSDARIQRLLQNDTHQPKTWYEVEVTDLTDTEVAAIVDDEYAALSQKLKTLLRNPASLYVWTQLDKSRRMQVITSANQLICRWWEQIIEHCTQKGFSSSEVDNVIKCISQKMADTSAFFLPRTSIIGNKPIIDVLVSEGMLINHGTKLAFSHQTFLDYFIVADQLEQLIRDKTIFELIGSTDCQTPNLRYRFLVLLQELLDMDEDVFLQQCRCVLDSDEVRHYYKCAVFEAAAQCANPSQALCDFVFTYWCKSTWREYIRQVVYYGNQPYISYLSSKGNLDCLSPDTTWLLRSICESDPDFVVKHVKPHCNKSAEDDNIVLNCLCFDADDDSEEMFKLRLDILKRNPEFLSQVWTSFYHLFKNNSSRIIDFMALLIECSEVKSVGNIHFPTEKELENYAKTNYRQLVVTIVPKLCTVTAGLANQVEKLWHSDVISRWMAQDHNDSALRKIVWLSKTALVEMAIKEPEKLLRTVLKDEYAQSLVGNELILSALAELSVDYADYIVEWMLRDFPTHLFNYTGKQLDYLETSKYIIKKYSTVCSENNFKQLEACILQWRESATSMIEKYKRRLEVNKIAGYAPVYYAYWGGLQKELLPCLDIDRISTYTKNMIAVTKRNKWIQSPYYLYPLSVGMAKHVVSPISEYTHRISDKTWLQVIRTPAKRMTARRLRETSTACIEATHSSFSSSLKAQAKKQPVRFAKLSLRFPDDCFPAYVSGVLCALQQKDMPEEYASVDLTCEVIRKYAKSDDAYVLECIAEIISARAEEDWPDDILRIIEDIALISVSKYSSRVVEQTGEKSAHELYMLVLNSPQGSAIKAISSLLFKKPALLDRFKATISELYLSDEPFILLALTDWCVPCYNQDKIFACRMFKSLVKKDIRMLIADQAWEIIGRDYANDPKFYRECLISAMRNGCVDLGECAARYLCATAVYQNDTDSLRFILENKHTDKQAESICGQAVRCFEYDIYRDTSKQIITHIVKNYPLDHYALGPAFFKNNIVIERDRVFLLELIAVNKKTRILRSLLTYLSETEENIVDFADVIHAVSKHLAELQEDFSVRLGIEEMIRCVVRLYDGGKDNPAVRTICLDAWDELFKNNLRDFKSLATILDNLS